MARPHRHPTARAAGGIVTIPLDCDVCGTTNDVTVPRMEPSQSVWLARGHTATTTSAQCSKCRRRMQVELALGARVVTPPPMPVIVWPSRVGYA